MSALFLCTGLAGCGKTPPAPPAPPSDTDFNTEHPFVPDLSNVPAGVTKLGLQSFVNAAGQQQFELYGKEFHNIGVDYYSLFVGCFTNKYNVANSLAAMQQLASYGVKAVRFAAAPVDYSVAAMSNSSWKYYTMNKAAYYGAMDQIVHKAESLNIGLVPSFFWGDWNLCNLFDEPWRMSLNDASSQTWKFRKKYLDEFVGRYAGSPALYMWEYGNEQADLYDLPQYYNKPAEFNQGYPLPPGSSRTARTQADDYVTYQDLSDSYSIFTQVIDEADSSQRAVATGDTIIRTYAYNAMTNHDYDADTFDQYDQMVNMLTPKLTDDPASNMFTTSSHMYTNWDPNAGADNTPGRWDNFSYSGINLFGVTTFAGGTGDLSGWDSWNSYYKFWMAMGAQQGKAPYIGECGAMYGWATADNHPNASTETDPALNYAVLCDQVMIQAAVDENFPLLLLWNYEKGATPTAGDYSDHSNGTEWSFNVENFPKGPGIMAAVKAANQTFVDNGIGGAPFDTAA